MWTILRNTLARSRGQILGWSLTLALLAAYLGAFYDTALTAREEYEGLMQGMPPEMLAFFGGTADMFSPEGYLRMYLFSYTPLVVGIYAVLLGSNLLAGDEERGTLDLVLAHPISRTRLYLGRYLAMVGALGIVMAVVWAALYVATLGTSLDYAAGPLALPFVSFLALTLCYGSAAVALSMMLPSRSAAAMTAGLLVLGDYFVTSFVRVNPDLETISPFLPGHYYQGAAALSGLDLGDLGALLATSAILAALGWWLFRRRDVRVAGEGSWQVPAWLRRRKDASGA